MTTFPNSPRLVKGGLALLDPQSGSVQRVIVLQYSPDTLSRTLQAQATGGEGGERMDALRLKGPPIETLSVTAEIDATDQLAEPDRNGAAVELGVLAQLAVLEAIVYPTSRRLEDNRQQAMVGQLEIIPPESPLTLFIWSKQRVMPVRLTEFSVTEEAFDSNLNPIRASIRLGMRVLSVDDLGFAHRGGSLFMTYLRARETVAGRSRAGTLSVLNLERIS